jgi:hypothetical protein
MRSVECQRLEMNLIRFGIVILVLLLIAPGAQAQTSRRKGGAKQPPRPQVTQQEIKELSDAASKSRENLIASSNTYRESLEKLLEIQRQEEERVAGLVEKNRQLLDMGLIAKREFDEGEQLLTEARAKLSETQKQIESVDHLVAEVKAAEQLAKMPAIARGSTRSSALVIRYVGASRWAMSDINKVDAFFRLKFSRPLPVSAIGQSVTHSQLGFDHHDASDVAVHPDSAEGLELINYLRSQGISFIAIRGAIAGSSTGAHIHIGPPSKRVTGQ